ncbi:hypothetical protein [Curtobacterium flaccumfaciens]|uniref:hypothetical protein n=1 Tax=Curtobacterium flaccumfaciens TaxID=2035 RepID=UPI0016043406|nr:hypothetical protein [Curtobacterium flaccumfaciens]MBB1197830.1 hypothetical protein [Curtobacterium flaccumfaciens]
MGLLQGNSREPSGAISGSRTSNRLCHDEFVSFSVAGELDLAVLAPALSAFAAGASAIVALLSFRIARENKKRDEQLLQGQHDRGRRTAITDAHLQMTSGEVAAARHLAGTLEAKSHEERPSFVHDDRDELTKAFYTLCWTIEYVANVREMWLTGERGKGPSKFLKWNEEAIYLDVKSIRTAIIGIDSSFEQSTQTVWRSVHDIARSRGFA